MGTFVLSPAARDDVESITTYVREAAGVEIARQLVQRLQEKCQRLADLPGQLGTPRGEIRIGVRSYAAPPYVIFFRYDSDQIQVIRILHERQDVESHIDPE